MGLMPANGLLNMLKTGKVLLNIRYGDNVWLIRATGVKMDIAKNALSKYSVSVHFFC